jgi:hypothetical protein
VHGVAVPQAAPRYHAAIRAAVARLDDGRPVAEIWRDVAGLAEALALPRPSYPHVYRLVHASRELRAARCLVQAMIDGGGPPRGSCL